MCDLTLLIAFPYPYLATGLVYQAAAAFTFVAAAGYISAMAVCGLIAILVTGAVVAFCVLATVFICTTLITLIITGVPVGYALFQVSRSHGATPRSCASGRVQPELGSAESESHDSVSE